MGSDEDRAFRLLGLATRAGQTQSGTHACELSVKQGRAKAMIIASDAAQGGMDKMKRLCERADVAVQVAGTGDLIGKYTGKGFRTVVAILDSGFAEQIVRLLQQDK